MIKNKAGDISVTILVIGVFAVCTFALFTFIYSSAKSENSIRGFEVMEQANSQIEKYYFYKNQGFSEEAIENLLDLQDCLSPDIGKCIRVNQTINSQEVYVVYKVG